MNAGRLIRRRLQIALKPRVVGLEGRRLPEPRNGVGDASLQMKGVAEIVVEIGALGRRLDGALEVRWLRFRSNVADKVAVG